MPRKEVCDVFIDGRSTGGSNVGEENIVDSVKRDYNSGQTTQLGSSSGGISTDPNLSATDYDDTVYSAANNNISPEAIHIVNNTNVPVRVYVANASNSDAPDELNDVVLEPGEHQFWLRKGGFLETMAVLRGDADGKFSSAENYSVSPGRITAIV